MPHGPETENGKRVSRHDEVLLGGAAGVLHNRSFCPKSRKWFIELIIWGGGRGESLPFCLFVCFVCFLIRNGATEVKECLWR